MDAIGRERSRGWALSAWLVLLLLINVWGTYRLAEMVIERIDVHQFALSERTDRLLLALIALELVAIGGIVAMWCWRLAGRTIYAASLVIAFLLNAILPAPPVLLIFMAANLVITWLLVASRAHDFD
jgi:hypothetical protein